MPTLHQHPANVILTPREMTLQKTLSPVPTLHQHPPNVILTPREMTLQKTLSPSANTSPTSSQCYTYSKRDDPTEDFVPQCQHFTNVLPMLYLLQERWPYRRLCPPVPTLHQRPPNVILTPREMTLKKTLSPSANTSPTSSQCYTYSKRDDPTEDFVPQCQHFTNVLPMLYLLQER